MNLLPLYVVYHNPSDFPGKFVVRRFLSGDPDFPDGIPDAAPLVVADDYEHALQMIPAECVSIGRMPGDDPVILEVWV